MSTQPGLTALTQAVTDETTAVTALTAAVSAAAAAISTAVDEIKSGASTNVEDGTVEVDAEELETQIGNINTAVVLALGNERGRVSRDIASTGVGKLARLLQRGAI